MVVCNRERVKVFDSSVEMVSEIENTSCEQNLTDADFLDFKTDMDSLSFYEKTAWNQCEDLIMVKNEEALWQAIVGEIKTPLGALSNSIGQTRYGCEIWEYRGSIINSLDVSEIEYYLIQTCLKYPEVNNVINIETYIGDKTALFVTMTLDTIYGEFSGDFRIPTAKRSNKKWRHADTMFYS